MKLTTEQYESITNHLRGHRITKDRRSKTRAGIRARVNLRLVKEVGLGPVVTARVRDLSAGGISLMMPAKLKAGQAFVVYLPSAEEVPLLLQYSVAACRIAGDQFVVGARLDRARSANAKAPSPMAVA